MLEERSRARCLFRSLLDHADPAVFCSPAFDGFHMGTLQILSAKSEVTFFEKTNDLYYLYKNGCCLFNLVDSTELSILRCDTDEDDADGIGERLFESTTYTDMIATVVVLVNRFYPSVHLDQIYFAAFTKCFERTRLVAHVRACMHTCQHVCQMAL